MTKAIYPKKIEEISSQTPILKGLWKFDERTGNTFPDMSGNEHTLTATGALDMVKGIDPGGAVTLDGSTQWLSTNQPVLRTDESFSIAAWVYLDSTIMNTKLELRKSEHSFALTAISQSSPTHGAFYLGIRRIEEIQPDGSETAALKWSFTVAPVDGSETAVLVWEHAYPLSPLDDSMLNKWIMLIGVCDVVERALHLYVPSINETGTTHVPDAWTFWHAGEGLQIGRARWLGRNVDQWPGKIGPVRAFSGILSDQDAKKLYAEDMLKR
jgi:hypothetical protein